MRKTWRIPKTLLLGLAALIGAGGLAAAQTAPAVAMIPLPADTIIGARQAGFDLQAGVAGAMKGVIEGGGDVKSLTDGAKGMVAWGHAIPTLFPDGTQTGHNTKAKPEVWSDRAGFEKAATTFWTEADKLVKVADANDKAGFAAQYTVTTKACGACHQTYRVRNN